jgi:hypothetical protein
MFGILVHIVNYYLRHVQSGIFQVCVHQHCWNLFSLYAWFGYAWFRTLSAYTSFKHVYRHQDVMVSKMFILIQQTSIILLFMSSNRLLLFHQTIDAIKTTRQTYLNNY